MYNSISGRIVRHTKEMLLLQLQNECILVWRMSFALPLTLVFGCKYGCKVIRPELY